MTILGTNNETSVDGFDELFERAGLNEDDASSQPSNASTSASSSGSSSSEGRSETKPQSMQQLWKPPPIPKAREMQSESEDVSKSASTEESENKDSASPEKNILQKLEERRKALVAKKEDSKRSLLDSGKERSIGSSSPVGVKETTKMPQIVEESQKVIAADANQNSKPDPPLPDNKERDRQERRTRQTISSSPPVTEISVVPPPDDDSTLGSEGLYFPRRRPEGNPPINTQAPTSSDNNDQYESWDSLQQRYKTMKGTKDSNDPPGVKEKPFEIRTEDKERILYTTMIADHKTNPSYRSQNDDNSWVPGLVKSELKGGFFSSDSTSSSDWLPYESLKGGEQLLQRIQDSPDPSNKSLLEASQSLSEGSESNWNPQSGSRQGGAAKSQIDGDASIDIMDLFGNDEDNSDSMPGSSDYESSGSSKPQASTPRQTGKRVPANTISNSPLEQESGSLSSSSLRSYSLSDLEERSIPVDDAKQQKSSPSEPIRAKPRVSWNPKADFVTYESQSHSFSSRSSRSSRSSEESKNQSIPRWMICLVLCFVVFFIAGAIITYFLLTNEENSTSGSGNPRVPTPSPISSSDGDILSLIESFIPGSEAALDDTSSPQYMAFSWLSDNENLSSFTKIQKLQRYMLAVLFYMTEGSEWEEKDLWLSNSEECDWYFSNSRAEICSNDGAIKEIYLAQNNLQGNLPWKELSAFESQVKVLDFDDNYISGTIPTILGDFGNLESLDLSDNYLSGTVPTELGLLSSLTYLDLRGNDLTGSVPTELCNLDLNPRLYVDCVIECDCCGDCNTPDIDIVNHEYYDLIVSKYPDGGKALQDSSSPQHAAFEWLISPLNDQDLSNDDLIQRYALATLYYSTQGKDWEDSSGWLSSEHECDWFKTQDSSEVCNSSKSYIAIYLQENNLDGTLPTEVIALLTSLESIQLHDNSISGAIPSGIDALSKLENLDLSSNDLFSIIPSQLSKIPTLKRIALADNKLFSTIPPEFGDLTNLESIDLGSNQLTGTIPTTFGLMDDLAGLSLYDNFLSGTLPTELSRVTNLQLVYLDGNQLVGSVGNGVCQLDHLRELWADCDRLECSCCTTCCNSQGCDSKL